MASGTPVAANTVAAANRNLHFYQGDVGSISNIEGSSIRGSYKALISAFTGGVFYGDTSSHPSWRATPQDYADIAAYRAENPGSYFATQIFAPMSKAQGGVQMALGLARHVETNSPLLLRNFAKNVGAKTYGELAGSWFPVKSKILELMHSSKQLHFNLDQFDLKRFNAFLRDPRYSEGNITNWELYTILKDKSLLSKTKFYGAGGREVAAPGL